MFGKFLIDRKTWGRGRNTYEHSPSSELLDGDGYRCCLGFVGKQCGIKDSDLLYEGTPADCVSKFLFPSFLIAKNSELNSNEGNLLMEINDDPYTSDHYKEKKIKHIFQQYGYEVNFI